ncbi:MAG: hypothetical protein M3436_05925 [Pseudomonadota bacterium]|nr:hypothetical protein [Pseudomonadota bacterium]
MATAHALRARGGHDGHAAHGAGHAPAAPRPGGLGSDHDIPRAAPVLSAAAEAVRAALCAGGGLFFEDLLARLRLLPSQLEAALSELAGQGSPHATASRGCARSLPAPGWVGVGRARWGGADGRRGPLVPDRDAARLGRTSRRRDRLNSTGCKTTLNFVSKSSEYVTNTL